LQQQHGADQGRLRVRSSRIASDPVTPAMSTTEIGTNSENGMYESHCAPAQWLAANAARGRQPVEES
jgi:hypothetical protein